MLHVQSLEVKMCLVVCARNDRLHVHHAYPPHTDSCVESGERDERFVIDDEPALKNPNKRTPKVVVTLRAKPRRQPASSIKFFEEPNAYILH